MAEPVVTNPMLLKPEDRMIQKLGISLDGMESNDSDEQTQTLFTTCDQCVEAFEAEQKNPNSEFTTEEIKQGLQAMHKIKSDHQRVLKRSPILLSKASTF